MQRTVIAANFKSEEDYFLFEKRNKVRHELINGNLYDISGASIFHNDIVLNLLMLFKKLLKRTHSKSLLKATNTVHRTATFFILM